jgi:multidrug efflux system outer membrane protein
MSRKPFHFIGVVTITLLVAGCAVGPNYRRPQTNAPAAFRSQHQTSSSQSLADLPWWKVFRDEALQQLIREALVKNYDLRIAVTRIEQARALLTQARSNFFPQLGYQAQATRLGGPQQVSVAGTQFAEGQTAGGLRTTSNTFAVAGNATWELDLWGRIRRENEAATALLLATEEARRGVVQSLVAEVAQTYFQLRDLDVELQIAERNRDAFNQIVGIFKKQKVGGIASDLEISRATALEAQIAASIPETERQIALTETALSFLLGRNPGPIARGATLSEQYSPPTVPAGLPSTLLERRPDIREAEQNLIAANANVGVAVANLLPTLDLTAALGAVSPQLYLLTSGRGNFWNVGGALTGPLFQGGRLVGRYHEMKALRDQAQLQYQRTALAAFGDVSNALVSRRKYTETYEQEARQVAALHVATALARERYAGGVSTYIEVLDAQEELFPAETALTRARLQQLIVIVQLYKALGGGWAESERSPQRFGFRFSADLRNP